MKEDRKIVSIEQVPIDLETSKRMRDAVTDALRAFADNQNLQHDYAEVGVAAVPFMKWWRVELEGGLVVLEIEAEVLLSPKPQDVVGESHIAYLAKPF